MKKVIIFESKSFKMFLLLFQTGFSFSQKIKPLNVIIILVDDMGHGDIGAHGNAVIKTSNFDKLYVECTRFSNFAVSPSCSPTPAALMTGSHEFLVGVSRTTSPMNLLDPDAVTIAQLFKKKGYRTGIFGKWHLGQTGTYVPCYRGFDETHTVPGNEDIDYILNDRARELCNETPKLLTLMRLGKWRERRLEYSPMYSGKYATNNFYDYQELFPIPQSEIERNTEAELEQTPGYN